MEWLKKLIKILLEKILSSTPSVKPDVEPEPEPELKPEPAVDDAIDLAQVSFDGDPVSPASWMRTAVITAAAWIGDGVKATHKGTDKWEVRPDGGVKPSIGNWVLIAKCADEKWHGSSFEWFGIGKTRVTGKKWDGTDDIRGTMGSWRPVKGETVYLMLCTVIRGAPFTSQQRSQAVKLTIN